MFVLRHPRESTPFPYTTLFRSAQGEGLDGKNRIQRNASDERLIEDVLAAVDHQVLPGDQVVLQQGDHRTGDVVRRGDLLEDRKSTRLNSSHRCISYAVFCLKKK